MSKMDGLRAMREARYQQGAAGPKLPPGQAPASAFSEPAESEAALCGHRAISGRTCTRASGHAAKSHRYA